ncbi:hypothetical protein DPMN_177606 [Dreissena polymorpha]|uniref:Uncharacterized protein n=1 Tax=Dreissena polymorpha TaxID=45954 RepID=A0A9D4EBY7_DREPO|nr:hypothetical protein DPMN_177606 [Dreissena polymorpha]
MEDVIIRTIDANTVRTGQQYFTKDMTKKLNNLQINILNKNPTKDRESYNDNDRVNTRHQLDDNKPEKDETDDDISEGNGRVLRMKERIESRSTSMQNHGTSYINPDGVRRLANKQQHKIKTLLKKCIFLEVTLK